MNKLVPIGGCVLVELTESFKYVATPEKQYSTKTSGIVIDVDNNISPKMAGKTTSSYLIGKKVYFEEYKDGTQIEKDDKTYAFIKLDDIRGYEDVEA